MKVKFPLILLVIQLSLLHAMEIEVECEYETDYLEICESKDQPVVCAIIDLILPDNAKLLITNIDEFPFNSMKIRQSVFHSFPVELLNQLPNIGILNVYKAEMSEIKDFTFKNASKLHELNIYHNELTEITENALKGASELKELSLHRNKIRKIHKNAFSTLKKLQWLDLTQNLLDFIEPEIFASLTNLKHIFLSECQLKKIDPDTFVKNTKLSTLHLDDNALENLTLNLDTESLRALYLHVNKLKSVTLKSKSENATLREVYAPFNEIREIFIEKSFKPKLLSLSKNKIESLSNITKLSSLIQLHISDNPVKDLTNIGQLRQLKRLYLDDTKIELKAGIFSSLVSLKSIHLSKLSLTHFDFDWLEGLSSLEMLKIEENQLEEIDFKEINYKLPSLKGIWINGNSFNCSYVQEMLGYLKNYTVIKILDANDGTSSDNSTEYQGISCNDGTYSNKNSSHIFRNLIIMFLIVFICAGIALLSLTTISKRYNLRISEIVSYRRGNNMNNNGSNRLVNEQ